MDIYTYISRTRLVQLVTPDNSSDVTGVEIAGALKNVLAIAAGIVEGMNLGNNSMAALVAQGCSEIRWLATKVFSFTLHSVACNFFFRLPQSKQQK